jgi:Uma2 family endonuclease
MEITDISQLDFTKQYSIADYLSWKFKERVELLKGYVAKMPSSPNSGHQMISADLTRQFCNFLHKKPFRAFAAPFDVYLPNHKNTGQTIVQPDLCVICDLEKIEKKGCVGAPDLIVEILSPGNSRKEVIDKYEIYQEAGVKEYWVIYPAEQVLQVYSLENAIFVAKKPNAPGDMYESQLFPELQINVEAIFEGAEGLI